MDDDDDEDGEPEPSEDAELEIAELSATISSMSAVTPEDRASMLQEHWEDLAWHAEHARRRGLTGLEALDAVLPHVPDGPHALVMQQALVKSQDLDATLQAVEQAAYAMAHGMALALWHFRQTPN